MKRNSNGTRVSYSYDDADRVTRVSNFTGSGLLMSDYASKYDKAGNRVRVMNNVGGRTTTYQYDSAYQLTSDHTGIDRNTYTYDPVGNRTVFKKADGTVATYTYDAANQLTRILEAGVPTTLTYDQVGNPLKQRNNTQPFNVTMVWDAQSRMTGYHQTGTSGGNPFNQQLTHTYNGDGQRVARQSPVLLVQYVWDGQNIHLKLDGGGSTLDQYHYEPRVYGNLIATGDYWHHYDPLGSTTNLTEDTGSIQASYRYGAWGEITSVFTNGSTVDPFLFVGRVGYYSDDEGIDKNDTSPLLPYYVRARYYNSAWGRWLNRDPFRINPNLWVYGSNDPVAFRDPSGLFSIGQRYCRGNDDPKEGQYPTATIDISITVDTRTCGLQSNPWFCEWGIPPSCTGSASVTLYYTATAANNSPLFPQGQHCSIKGNQLVWEGPGGKGDTLSTKVDLGTVACKGGTLSGKLPVICEVKDIFTGKTLDKYTSQVITYSIQIKECGQQGKSSLDAKHIQVPGKLPNPLTPCPDGSKG